MTTELILIYKVVLAVGVRKTGRGLGVGVGGGAHTPPHIPLLIIFHPKVIF